jgi:hypothetical protein
MQDQTGQEGSVMQRRLTVMGLVAVVVGCGERLGVG